MIDKHTEQQQVVCKEKTGEGKTFNPFEQELQDKIRLVTRPTNTFVQAGELNRLTIQKHSKMPDLFDVMPKKAHEEIKELQANGQLFSLDACGIAPQDKKTYRVITALSQILYEQSEIYGDTVELTAGTAVIKEQVNGKISVPGDKTFVLQNDVHTRNGRKTEIAKVNGQQLRKGTKIIAPYAMIATSTTQIARMINGGRKPNEADKLRVNSILNDLSKYIYIPLGNGKLWKTYIISQVGEEDEKTHECKLIITLSPIFTRLLSKDRVGYRKDTLQLTKNLTVLGYRLYLLLNEVLSRKYYHGQGKWSNYLDDLFDTVANFSDTYVKRPKRRLDDFRAAVEELKRIKLITDYRVTTAANGKLMAEFTLNTKFYTEDLTDVTREFTLKLERAKTKRLEGKRKAKDKKKDTPKSDNPRTDREGGNFFGRGG